MSSQIHILPPTKTAGGTVTSGASPAVPAGSAVTLRASRSEIVDPAAVTVLVEWSNSSASFASPVDTDTFTISTKKKSEVATFDRKALYFRVKLTSTEAAVLECWADITFRADLQSHLADGTGAHDASAVTYSGDDAGLDASNVQDAIDELAGLTLTPEMFGAVGDGVANDTAAFTALAAAASGIPARGRSGATYLLPTGTTINRDFDFNRATLTVTGDLTVTNSANIRNGTINVSGAVKATSASYFEWSGLTVTNTLSTSEGIKLTTCTHARVLRCRVTGGFRGISAVNCDSVTLENNSITAMSTTNAIGILVYSTSGVHAGNRVLGNKVVDAYFGISINGGEANSANGGYTGLYRNEDVVVSGNYVAVTTPDTLIGSIWLTCTRRATVVGNTLDGGLDVGIDFEHCCDSTAVGNTVNNIHYGGLSAIFGSERIVFADNVVTYTRSVASETPAGATGPNSCGIAALLRHTPKDITFKGNKFLCLNGKLQRASLGLEGSQNVSYVGNDFFNVYLAESNSTTGGIINAVVQANRFVFDIALNWPVIYTERVNGFHVEDNHVKLAGAESGGFSTTLPYVGIYDSGTGTSTGVYLRRNNVEGAANTNNTIAVHTNNASLVGAIEDNNCVRVGAYYGVTYTALRVAGNRSAANPHTELLPVAHDNGSALCTIRPRFGMTTNTQTSTSWTIVPGADLFLFNNGSAGSWTLPDATANLNGIIRIKSINSGTLTVGRAGSDVIHTTSALNQTSLSLTAGQSVTLLARSGSWLAL